METETSGQASARSGPKNLQPPKVSLEFAISPEIHSLSEDTESPILTITITSHAAQPITIFTFRTFLDPSRAMSSIGYHIIDADTKQRIYRPIEHIQTRPFRRRIGHVDEPLFWTLYPEEPRVVTSTFHFANLWRRRAELAGRISQQETRIYKGEEMRTFLEPGHRYTFGKPQAGLQWWRWGTKAENLEPPNAPPTACGMGWSEPYLKITDIKQAQIEIRA
jgi:hypothetical protein